MTPSRQLAAILFTDIVGYTAMMQEEETAAMAVIRNYTKALREVMPQYQGTIINDYGDGNLCTFTSVTEAVRCAIDLQRKLQAEPKVPLRVGLHVGEIFFEDGKVFGDGVNVASRIQSLGVANSILFSAEIHSKISNQSEFKAVSLGRFHFKNVSVPMEVFALSNEGLTVPERGNMEGKLKALASPMKKWIAAGTLVLIVVAVSLLYTKLYNQPDPENLRKSVAVLAFEDMSPNKDQEWFSDGISEEIINSLANLRELKVMARTSSFYFKGKDIPFEEIVAKLGVDHLVEGSVQRIGDRLRITVQLVTKEGFHLFSNTYDRPATDLFEVRSEIAESIANALLNTITSQQKVLVRIEKPSSTEVYESYLLGVRAYNKFTSLALDRDFLEAQTYLLKAISLDRNYSPTYGALADLYDSRGNITDRTRYWRLRDSVTRVGLRVNPHSKYPLLMRANAFTKSAVNLDSAHFYLKKAYGLYDTDPYTNFQVASFYIRIGLFEKGRKHLTKILEVDPLDLNARHSLALAHIYLGEFENARSQMDRIVELDSSAAHYGLALISVYTNDLRRAEKELMIILRSSNNVSPEEKALLLAAKGNKLEALGLSKGIRVLLMLRMKKESLEQLDSLTMRPIPFPTRGVSNVIFSIDALDKSPLWEFVRSEPEFKRIRGRVKERYDERLSKYGSLD